MGKISYFQRYSQRENHVTNNTLLVMRHFYHVSPQKISDVFSRLCDDNDLSLSVGLQFKQQIRSSNSVPDALISQAPLEIYFETKRGGQLDVSQIERHFKSISRNTINQAQKILFGLTKVRIDESVKRKLVDRARVKNITFVPIIFADIVRSLREVCEPHETSLSEILSDYENYLESEKLLQTGQILSAFPVGRTFDKNVKHRLYFEPSDRPSKQGSSFIGLYRKKRIEQIASFDTVVVGSDLNEDFLSEKGELSDEKWERIRRAIEDYPDLVDREHRYYLFDNLYCTNFVKHSKGGMIGYRKFHLSKLLNDHASKKQYSAQEVAKLLKDKNW